ncbi:MAG: SDR family oxidoreductase [Wenzhouxiangellaceae bacterium]
MRLAGKNTLITGGNSGIGLGIARRFRDEGASGVIIGRNMETLQAAEQSLGESFKAIPCDVTDLKQLDQLYTNVHERHGPIDVLVANAGGAIGPGTIQPFDQVDETSFDAMVQLNFKSTFFTVQKALPYLNDGASIILVASIAVHKGFPGMSVYAACKGAVRVLARSLAAELMSRGIRVNVLSPGTIDTPVFGKFGFAADEAEHMKSQFAELIPMKRLGTQGDMGGVALFLASSDSAFVTGEEIIADGGVVNL